MFIYLGTYTPVYAKIEVLSHNKIELKLIEEYRPSSSSFLKLFFLPSKFYSIFLMVFLRETFNIIIAFKQLTIFSFLLTQSTL